MILPPYTAVVRLPFGPMGVACSADAIIELAFLPPDTPELAPQTPLAERAATALRRWPNSPDAPHGLPLALRGTPFQRRVWSAIAAIPLGQTRCYGDLARDLGSAARAVGGACGANPFPLFVPCHRVVSHHGPGGFAGERDGYLIGVKQWLLAHEAAHAA